MFEDLQLYLQKKDADAENLKLSIKTEHMSKINSEYKVETEILCNIITKASEIIQENYLLLRSMGELDNGTLDKLQKMVKLLQGQRSVKFAEDDITLNHTSLNDNMTFQHIDMSHTAEESHLLSPVVSRKRGNQQEMDVDVAPDSQTKKTKSDDLFLKPKALKAINFGAVPNVPSTDMNATFNLESEPPKSLPSTSSATAKGIFLIVFINLQLVTFYFHFQ